MSDTRDTHAVDYVAEIARLKAALARVTAQRDQLAIDLHNEQVGVFLAHRDWTENAAKARVDGRFAQAYGLRIENGEVEEASNG